MSTNTTHGAAPAPAPLLMIRVAEIEVEEGHNPRAEQDPEAQAALEASIRQVGVLQPVLVRPREAGDGYVLVAGHRRLAAASAAGLEQVPALVLQGGGRPAERALLALAENVLRQDLNPIEEARALERIRRAQGFRTHRALAERLGLSVGWVAERLRLLRLPAGCQAEVAAGRVPLRACASLERIARVSAQVAEACCALIGAGSASAAQLEGEPAALVRLVGRAEWSGERPCCVPVPGYATSRVSDLPLPVERAQELCRRAEALGEGWVRLDEDDADAAGAYGALLEFPVQSDRFARERFICSPELLADRVALKLERAEALVRERAAAAAERGAGAAADCVADVPQASAEVDRAGERERARAERGLAHRANAELGLRLAEAYAAPALTAEMARLVCLIVFQSHERQLGPNGLRLCAPGWQRLEARTLKSGARRERVVHPDRAEAAERARAFLAGAHTPQEIVGRTLQALIAASYADQAAVPVAERGWNSGAATFGGGEIARITARLARDLLPERLARLARERAGHAPYDELAPPHEADAAGGNAAESAEGAAGSEQQHDPDPTPEAGDERAQEPAAGAGDRDGDDARAA